DDKLDICLLLQIPDSAFETRSLPALTRSYPRHFTFCVAHPIRSIQLFRFQFSVFRFSCWSLVTRHLSLAFILARPRAASLLSRYTPAPVTLFLAREFQALSHQK